MCKAVDKDSQINNIRLLYKAGRKKSYIKGHILESLDFF
jgi:molybdenum cofactor biosynthesis enzyme